MGWFVRRQHKNGCQFIPFQVVAFVINITWSKLLHSVLACWYLSIQTNLRTASSLVTRRLMGSTDLADPSCFYFRISWILMDQHCFYVYGPLGFLQGLKNWLFQNVGMKFWTKIVILRFWGFWGPAENRGDKKIKTILIHQYSWNSEVETTWIS